MTDHDDRTPSPTDPPIETVVTEAKGETDDTEAHSMLDAELGRAMARDHVREANRIARDQARVREARSGSDGGFLKRFGRR